MSRESRTGWTPLLDRVEARVRRLEAAAAAAPGTGVIDPGPDPTLELIPQMAPTRFERDRLASVLEAHRAAQAKLSAARASR